MNEAKDWFALYSTFKKSEFLNAYICPKYNLIMTKVVGADLWAVYPNTNIASDVNTFYSFFNDGLQGSFEECVKKINDHYESNNVRTEQSI